MIPSYVQVANHVVTIQNPSFGGTAWSGGVESVTARKFAGRNFSLWPKSTGAVVFDQQPPCFIPCFQ